MCYQINSKPYWLAQLRPQPSLRLTPTAAPTRRAYRYDFSANGNGCGACYPSPVARIGRLAMDLREQGNGVGAALLAHAMQLAVALAQKIGLHAVVVDAKNGVMITFYERYGFQRFADRDFSLFVTIDVIRRAIAASARK